MKEYKKRMIKKSEYFTLVGLLALAKENNKQNEKILEAVSKITEEKEYDSGHSADAVYGSLSADELLKKFGIKVRSF
jgi:hypothetical protein